MPQPLLPKNMKLNGFFDDQQDFLELTPKKKKNVLFIIVDWLGKEMETHSSVLAWRVPGMGEPGGLPSMGSHRVGHD